MGSRVVDHNRLDWKIIEEAGFFHHQLGDFFNKIISGDETYISKVEELLQRMQFEKSAACCRRYEHSYERALLIRDMVQEIRTKGI